MILGIFPLDKQIKERHSFLLQMQKFTECEYTISYCSEFFLVCIMLAFTITNFTSFPPRSAPGGGPWLWRCIRSEPLTLAYGGPSAGAPLGVDRLQTPRHPIMTSEKPPDRTLSPSLGYLPDGNQHATLPPKTMNADDKALVTNKKENQPVSPTLCPSLLLIRSFSGVTRSDFTGCEGSNVTKEVNVGRKIRKNLSFCCRSSGQWSPSPSCQLRSEGIQRLILIGNFWTFSGLMSLMKEIGLSHSIRGFLNTSQRRGTWCLLKMLSSFIHHCQNQRCPLRAHRLFWIDLPWLVLRYLFIFCGWEFG